MKKWNMTSAAALVVALGMMLAWAAESRAEVETNKPAPDFTFVDIEGTSGKLSDFKGKVVVLEWFNQGCPFVRKHYDSHKMQDLQRKYTEKDVVWIAINSTGEGYQDYRNAGESVKDVDSNGTSATYVVLDPEGKTGTLYGAKTTPHIFIINEEGILVYQGAADDIKSTDVADIEKADNYIDAALTEVLAGKPVTVPETKAYGCSVKYKR